MSTLMNYVIPFASFSWLMWYLFRKATRKARLRRFLYEKVVLITGASSGLGEAMARVFHRYGAKVILVSRNIDKLNRLKQVLIEMYPEGFPPFPVRLDLEKLDEIHRIAEGIVQIYGKVDILINNAGLGYRGTIMDTQLAVYQKLMNVNLFGQIELTKTLMPHFVAKREGFIVGIGSVQSQISIPYRSAYAASKHAFSAFLDCLRAEASVYKGINVLCVNPGYIKTNASMNSIIGDGSQYKLLDETQANGMDPLELAEEIAYAVLCKKKEILITESYQKIAVIIRHLLPDLFFNLMERRAAKQLPNHLR
ncbi:dehydrogenase/reductase SDR family member 7B-like [Brevipalpus obovatus]|uniref:dehydrogenase/reductase SDR family member 7B-like n=1 Tax=Brevipalpus obovatus TaxID=246614 RepID=UPI003D9F5FB5